MTSFADFETAFLAGLQQERSDLQALQDKGEAQLSAWIQHLFQVYLGYVYKEILSGEGLQIGTKGGKQLFTDLRIHILDNGIIFIECKRLGRLDGPNGQEELNARNQLMSYIRTYRDQAAIKPKTVLGVITDGDRWVLIGLDKTKEFHTIAEWAFLTDDPRRIAQFLWLLAKPALAQPTSALVEFLARRRLAEVLKENVQWLTKKVNDNLPDGIVSKELIGRWLRDAFFDPTGAPPLVPGNPLSPAATTPAVANPLPGNKETEGRTAGALPDLIAAGILKPPLKLFRKYKGQAIEADLLPDGKVVVQGVAYESCSQAAAVACGRITGRSMSMNGWTFWQYRNASGQRLCLNDARRRSVQGGKGEGNNDPTGEKPINAAQTRILLALAAAGRPLNKAAIIERAKIQPNYVAEYCGHDGEMKSDYVLGNGPKKLVPAGLVSIVKDDQDGTGEKSYTLTAAGKTLANTLAAGKPPSTEGQPERYGLRQRFWIGLLSRPTAKGTRHANLSTSGEYSYIGAGSGVGGLAFNYVIRQDEGTVELYIDRGPKEANKQIHDWLHKHKDKIEGAFGGQLSWQRLNDKKSCRIAYTMTAGGYRSDPSQWPGIQDAMIDAMTRLEKALAPHLENLKSALPSLTA